MKVAVLLGWFLAVNGGWGHPVEDEPTCGYNACNPTDASALNVHIVPHSHDDVGWTKTVDKYYFQDVQNVLSSVVQALLQNPDRRFVQVETAFFKMWWQQQKDSVKEEVRDLVQNGRLEIINGAWSMNDEAAPNYQYTIDQYTLGLRYLEDELGPCSRPKICWQIDSFGHGREQASLSAQMGFDGILFARLDYRDKQERLDRKASDLLWRGSQSLNDTDVFTSALYYHYSAPPGFCWDIVCNDEPIIDDEESFEYNYERRVQEFADFVREQADKFATNHIIVVMGDDFRYQAALNTYINIDRLIKGFEKFPQTYNDKPIKVLYSTPSCYTKAINDYAIENNFQLEIKTDDFFPYADNVGNYVVGYFTSRSASKRFVRVGNNILQASKQLATVGKQPYDNPSITLLKEAMGVMQHHDAITGTELQDVARDYHRLLYKAIDATDDVTVSILSNIVGGDFNFKSCLLANVSHCPQTKSDQFSVLIYNPLSRVVSSPISIPVDSDGWKVQDPAGSDVASQISSPLTDFSSIFPDEVSSNTLDFVAKNLPPLGYNVYTVTKSSKKQSKKVKIGDGDTTFEIDNDSGLLKSITMNGVTLDVSQNFLFYKSAGGSQCWVFTPDGNTPQVVSSSVKTTLIDGDVYFGVLQEFNDWTKQMIKVYKEDNSYIEFDWIVGPLDISDGGKEVISQFTTPLNTEGIFYTDSNGRETMKRVRNFRPDFQYTDEQPVSGNYYPVTSRITIRDEEQGVEFALLTDRALGGSSINDGQVELMVHRAIREGGDGFGLAEDEYGKGIVVRGRHWVVVGPIQGDKSISAIERDIAQRKFLEPWLFFTNDGVSGQLTYQNLNKELPENVQVLTLEPWGDNTVLLRLEHFYEKDEDSNLSQEATVDVSDLFVAFTITAIQEMSLAGTIPLDETQRLHWPGGSEAFTPTPPNGLEVTLSPMQIRTFVATITYN